MSFLNFLHDKLVNFRRQHGHCNVPFIPFKPQKKKTKVDSGGDENDSRNELCEKDILINDEHSLDNQGNNGNVEEEEVENLDGGEHEGGTNFNEHNTEQDKRAFSRWVHQQRKGK